MFVELIFVRRGFFISNEISFGTSICLESGGGECPAHAAPVGSGEGSAMHAPPLLSLGRVGAEPPQGRAGRVEAEPTVSAACCMLRVYSACSTREHMSLFKPHVCCLFPLVSVVDDGMGGILLVYGTPVPVRAAHGVPGLRPGRSAAVWCQRERPDTRHEARDARRPHASSPACPDLVRVALMS